MQYLFFHLPNKSTQRLCTTFLNKDKTMVQVCKPQFCVLSEVKVWKGKSAFKESLQSVGQYKKGSDSN